MKEVTDWIWNNWGMIATALFGVSEVLANIPAIKSNGVFQAIYNILRKIVKKTPPVP
jgi:hypothetical protein